jgi:hypothetical protein
MTVLCDCLMIGLFHVTRPLKRSRRGGADDTPEGPVSVGTKTGWSREDDTCASQVDMGTTPHKASNFMWYVGAMDTEKQVSSWRPLRSMSLQQASFLELDMAYDLWQLIHPTKRRVEDCGGTKMGATGFSLDKDQHRCSLCGT